MNTQYSMSSTTERCECRTTLLCMQPAGQRCSPGIRRNFRRQARAFTPGGAGVCPGRGLRQRLHAQAPRAVLYQEPEVTERAAGVARQLETVPEMWPRLAKQHPDLVAVEDPHNISPDTLTFAELHAHMRTFGAGLHSLGLRRGDNISLFAENSWRWLVADQGVMMNGAVDAVRGTSSPPDELRYILSHSDSAGLVVQDAATLAKVLPGVAKGRGAEEAHQGAGGQNEAQVPPLRFVVLLWGEPPAGASAALGCPVLSFDQVMESGRQRALEERGGGSQGGAAWRPVTPGTDDPATIVFTSGTTGNPKGVVLSHGNLSYQLAGMPYFLELEPGNGALSLLPPWHIYERTAGYYILSQGCRLMYSNIRKFRDDLGQRPPDYFVCVPLVLSSLHDKVMATLRAAPAHRRAIAALLMAASFRYVRCRRTLDGVDLAHALRPAPWHTLMGAALLSAALLPLHRLAQALVYKKIRTALGIRRAVVSGGGSLPAQLDDFYEAIGLTVINGWGLSETSPVLACRRAMPGQNVRGSVGLPMPDTEVRVVDPVSGEDVPDGQQGLVMARGPGVMRLGYYKQEAATARAFPFGDGWFDTGDLGWIAPQGVPGSRMGGTIVLTGRAKDTIVLSSGKNVEPQVLEDMVVGSSRFVAACVCVGQDHRVLGALVAPNSDALAELAAERGVESLSDDEVYKLLRAEISAALSGRAAHEHISEFALLPQPLSVDDGTLTRTMKPRRPQIMEKYAREVEQLLKKLR